MLELLKIGVEGFKLLDDDFMLDLTSKARVHQEDKDKEVLELEKGLYVFRSNAFVGGNSSGKSTVLSLILKTLSFLQTGRWKSVEREFKNNEIILYVMFYIDGYLYEYKAKFNKIIREISSDNIYSPIKEVFFRKMEYNKVRGIKSLDLIAIDGENLDSYFSSSLDDTSAIKKLTANHVLIDDFSNNNISNLTETIIRETFFRSLSFENKDLVISIIRLLDNSIEYIIYDDSTHIKFKRFNTPETILSNEELIAQLSSGTFRGIELYIRCVKALKDGAFIIVDEIENSFQKNLVFDLLSLFNDEDINKKGAKLYFSTHYTEILDYFNRRDNIFITHKDNGIVNIKNLYSDYNVRTELLKSKQFDNNVFDTSMNYDQLLIVRKEMSNEL